MLTPRRSAAWSQTGKALKPDTQKFMPAAQNKLFFINFNHQ